MLSRADMQSAPTFSIAIPSVGGGVPDAPLCDISSTPPFYPPHPGDSKRGLAPFGRLWKGFPKGKPIERVFPWRVSFGSFFARAKKLPRRRHIANKRIASMWASRQSLPFGGRYKCMEYQKREGQALPIRVDFVVSIILFGIKSKGTTPADFSIGRLFTSAFWTNNRFE